MDKRQLDNDLRGCWRCSSWALRLSVSLAAFPGAPHSTAANTFKTSGLRAGVYIGLNIQVGPSWVVGIEGDWAGYKHDHRRGASRLLYSRMHCPVLSSPSV